MVIGISNKTVHEDQLFKKRAGDPGRTAEGPTQVGPSSQTSGRHFITEVEPAPLRLLELSSTQMPILNRELYSPHTGINSQIVQMCLHGQATWDLVETVIHRTVAAHDALRLHLLEADGQIRQYVALPQRCLAMNYVTLTQPEYQHTHADWASQAITVPFNLIDSPLCKFYLIRFANGEKGFALQAHQLICDTRSLWLAARDIHRRFENCMLGGSDIETPSVSVISFLAKEEDYLHSPRFEWDRRYWILRSKSIFSFTTLKKYSFHLDTLAIDTLCYTVDAEATANIRTFCANHRITLYQFFLAIVGLLLGQRTGRDEVALGQCVTRRFNKSMDEMIGACEVVLPLALRIDRHDHFLNHVHRAASARRELQRHAHFPSSSITQIIEATHTGLHLLFDLLLRYCPSMEMEKDAVLLRSPFSEYPLTLHLQESAQQEEIRIEWDFQICAWTAHEINQLHEELLTLIRACLANPQQPLALCGLPTRS